MRTMNMFGVAAVTLVLSAGSLWSQSVASKSHILNSFRNHPALVRGATKTSVRSAASFPSVHNFATTDFPGSSDTLALDRNPASGMVVGIFNYTTSSQQQGFTLKGANYKVYNVPGAGETLSVGIGSLNQITGAYVDSSGAHGFVDNAGVITTVDFPGSTFTIVWEINVNGDLVGEYNDGTNTHGFINVGGTFTTIDPPGSTYTEAVSINSAGAVVGQYEDANNAEHGFIYSGGVYTNIDFPLATDTIAIGINDQGTISGYFRDSASVPHGFLFGGGKFGQVDVPGAAQGTWLTRVKNKGALAGAYYDDRGGQHGIVAPH